MNPRDIPGNAFPEIEERRDERVSRLRVELTQAETEIKLDADYQRNQRLYALAEQLKLPVGHIASVAEALGVDLSEELPALD